MGLRYVTPEHDRHAEIARTLRAWSEADRSAPAIEESLATLHLDEGDVGALLSDPELMGFRRALARRLGPRLFSRSQSVTQDEYPQGGQTGRSLIHFPSYFERFFPKSLLSALAEHEAVRYFIYSLAHHDGEGCRDPFRVLRALDANGSGDLLRNSVARCILLYARGLEALGQGVIVSLSQDQKANFFVLLQEASGVDRVAFTEACVMAIEGVFAFPEYAFDLERSSCVGGKGFVPRYQFERMAQACGYATEDAFFASLTPDARRVMQASYVRECATARLDGDRLLYLLENLPSWALEIRDQAVQAIHDRVVTKLLTDPAHADDIAQAASWHSVISRYFAEDDAASFCRRYARLGESIEATSPSSVHGYARLAVQMDRCGYSLEDIQFVLRQTMEAYPEDSGAADEHSEVLRAVCARFGRPGEALDYVQADKAMAHIGYTYTDAYDVNFRSGEKARVSVWIAVSQRREGDGPDAA